jgi:peptide/nickel transport system substrate-binding protein
VVGDENRSYWLSGRVSRRRVLQGVATAGVGGLGAALIGCGRGSPSRSEATSSSASQAAAGTPKRGGTLVNASSPLLLGTTDLDPHTAANTAVMQVWQSISRGLFQIDAKTNAPANDFASAAESPDPTRIVVTIPDASWENKSPVNGRKVTSADVKYSLDRIRSAQPGFTRGSTIQALDHVETPDDKHAVLVLKQPSVSFAYGLSFGLNVIVAREVVEKFGDLKSPSALIGMGPYTVESFEPNVQATLTRRTDSWMGDRPYLDKIKYLNLLDTAAQIAAYRSGQIQITNVPLDQESQFRKEFAAHTFQSRGNTNRPTLTLRHDGRVAAIKDLRVRQALNLAIDRNEAVQVFFSGEGKPVGTMAWVLDPFATPQDTLATYPGYGKDKAAERAEAMKLLKAAGQENLSFELLSANLPGQAMHAAIAQFLQDQLKRVGVTAKLKLIEYTSYKKQVDDGNWETTADPYSSGYNPDEHLRLYAYTNGSRNYGKYSNPSYDKLVDQADQEMDAAKRANVMHQAQKLLVDDVERCWLASGTSVVASSPQIKGYNPSGEYPFIYRWENVWLQS